MKKTYLQPSIEMEDMGTETMICASLDITSSNGDITYGGVDEEGEKDPTSRRNLQDVWDDDDSENF